MTVDEPDSVSSQLSVIPEIPNEIIDAINARSLVVFIGAGVSGLFRMPMWTQLALNILRNLNNEKIDGKRMISHSTKEVLSKESGDPRRLLSILYEMCDDKNIFFKHVESELTLKSCSNHNQMKVPIELLNILERWNSSIVTTNYDDILDNYLNGYDIYLSGKDIVIPEGGFRRPYVLHLHGSIKKKEDMIITVSQYYSMYHGDGEWERARQFLKSLFQNNTVLFIGYGLKDYEILEYTMASGRENSFFLLEPHTQIDSVEIEPLKRFYKSVNVTMLPYLIDEDGYETILDVLKMWELKFNECTRIPADRCHDIDDIISKIPDELSINRLWTMLGSEKYLTYFLRKIDNSEFEFDWVRTLCERLCHDKDHLKRIIDCENRYCFRLLLIRLCDTLHLHNEDESLRKIAYFTIHYISSKPVKMESSDDPWVYRQIVELIVLLMDEFDDSILEFLEQVSEKDIHASHIIDSISKNIENFKKLSINSKMLLINFAVKHSIQTTSTPSSSYWAEVLLNSTENILNQRICRELFKTLSPMINDFFHNQPYSGLSVGSINNYLITDRYHDEEYFLIKWFHIVVGRIPSEDLQEFVREHIQSKIHLENTLALHAVNLHFDRLQNILWEIDDYSRLNYSEFYELVRNNVFNFNEKAIARFISVVQVSYDFDSEQENLTRLYRYDLLKLLPSDTSGLDLVLKDNYVESREQYETPENRGKQSTVSFTWESDEEIPILFSNMNEVICKINNGNVTHLEKRSIHKYIEKNVIEFVNNSELLRKIPIEYYPTIYESLEHLDEDFNTIFQTLIRISDIILDEDPNYHNGCLHVMERWSGSHDFDSELSHYLIKTVESKAELFFNSEIYEYDDKVLESLNNWYVGILWLLLKGQRFITNDVVKQRLIPTIDSIIENGGYENRLILCVLLSNIWRYISYTDEKWASDNYKRVICNFDSIWPISMYLLSGHACSTIYDELYQRREFNKILNLDTTDNTILTSIMHLGALSVYLYETEHDPTTIETIKCGAASINSSQMISGILTELDSEDDISDETEKSVIQTIIDYIPERMVTTFCTAKLAKYLESSKGSTQNKLELAVKISKLNMTHVPESLISVLENKFPDRPETLEIVENISKQPLLYYPESFLPLMKKLSAIDQYKNRVRIICNRLGEKGFDEYYEIAYNIE